MRPADLAGHRIWIPGIRPGTEWAAFYEALSHDFGLSIDALGPSFGDEALMDALADSGALATLVGSGDRYLWPHSHDLRRIPLREPAPVYPHVLLSRAGDPHPVLAGGEVLEQGEPGRLGQRVEERDLGLVHVEERP